MKSCVGVPSSLHFAKEIHVDAQVSIPSLFPLSPTKTFGNCLEPNQGRWIPKGLFSFLKIHAVGPYWKYGFLKLYIARSGLRRVDSPLAE